MQLLQKKWRFDMCKKIFVVLCTVIIAVLTIPEYSFAQSYTVNKGEITISFDEEKWIVFTRDNIKDNKELEKLDVSYKNMKSTMEKSSAYIVAFCGGKKERMEVLVRAVKNKYINNICTLEDDEKTSFLKGVDETYSSSMDNYQSEFCELGAYQYVKMTGNYDKDDYSVIEYLTIINGTNYLISAQKAGAFTKGELKEFTATVEDISFQVDPKLTENNVRDYVQERQEQMEQNGKNALSVPQKIGATILVVLAIILILKFKNRKRKRKIS